MLFRAVLLGLVLTSFVLALPTVREEAALERNELNGKYEQNFPAFKNNFGINFDVNIEIY